MPKLGKTGITRIVSAFGYSMQGITAAYKHEAAFRQELLLAVILIPSAFFITRNAIELALMIGSVILVLLAANLRPNPPPLLWPEICCQGVGQLSHLLRCLSN